MATIIRTRIFLFLFILLFVCGIGETQAFPTDNISSFSNLSLKDGLSQLSVIGICQDSRGYMWFGTRNGLNKYDGNSITIYKHSEGDSLSLESNNITALAEDHNRLLWIGTSRGLNCLDLRTDKITSYSRRKFQDLESGVAKILVDSKNRLWVGTPKGLFLFVREAETFQPVLLGGKIKGEMITALAEIADHRLLVGTQNKGLFVCDMDMKLISHYAKDDGENPLPDNHILRIFEDSRKQLWVSTNNGGFFRLNLKTGAINRFCKANSALSSDNVRCLAEADSMLFIGTFDGLYTLDLLTDKLSACANATVERRTLSHFSIYDICVDRSGNVWIGTYSGGVNYYSKYRNRFTVHEPGNTSDRFVGVCGEMTCADNQTVYVATEGSGLLSYNIDLDRYRYYLFNVSGEQQYGRNIVKSVWHEDNYIWCGTAQGEIYRFDIRTKHFQLYYTLPIAVSTSIYSIIRSEDGNFWLATSKPQYGLIKVTSDKQMQNCFTVVGAEKKWSPGSSRCLLELEKGVFLIGTHSNGLYVYDENRHTYDVYCKNKSGSHYLPSDYITSIVRTASGQIWIASFGGGISLFDKEKGMLKHITKGQGLKSDDIFMMVEDRSQNLWISATGNISKYSPETGQLYNYPLGNDIGSQEFTPHSGLLLPNGDICFSTNSGFISFSPSKMQLNTSASPLVLTKLSVNNKIIVPSEQGILTSVIDDMQEIELDYDQNNISIGYSILNYVYPEQNQYAYYLKGYDETWNYVGNRREAFYTNLRPGKYVFEVKAANNDGIWCKARTVHIVVHPPVWKTWYAFSAYIILFVGFCIFVMYYTVKKKKLEQELVYEHLKQQQAEEFHQAKMRMFTNFSHELRTPLMLIVPPLQKLLQRQDFNLDVRNKLNLIYNNSQRLMLLVNQLMDLRKNQEGKMQLKIAKDDMCSFLREMYFAFNQIASAKGLDFRFSCGSDSIIAWFDKSLFEKVVFNLLSNAFKFTQDGGAIVLSVDKVSMDGLPPEQRCELQSLPDDAELVCLSVSDTGCGISQEEKQKIFAPFYQIDDGSNKKTVGTGIGLSLTRSIVLLHHGVIWVENNNEKVGVTFRVVLPVNREVYTDGEMDKEAENRVVIDVIPSVTNVEAFQIEKKYTVLLVEDDSEVRGYVKECLSPFFYVLEADNGETAFEMTVEKYPDIVVSDIMMPRKDGLELCKDIKDDLRTGHIPVVLMTARSMVMHIKEGFSCGADDYIVKPFNMDVLIYRLKNILLSREKLKSLYGKKFSPEAMGIEIVLDNDKFTQKFFSAIEKHLTNPDLNIDMLCREVGLSRTNLYRKLKAITDLSPTELIRNKRLEVAAKLLVESDYSVSEISTYVGFNSHAYFTQCFKAVYGCSPTEFLVAHKK